MNNMFGGNKLDGFPHSRSLHYSYHPQTDIAFSFNTKNFNHIKHKHINGVILFKEFKEQVPFWVEEYIKNNPQKSIEAALKSKHSLEKNGAEFLYYTNFESHPLKIENPYIQGNKYYPIDNDEYETLAIADL